MNQWINCHSSHYCADRPNLCKKKSRWPNDLLARPLNVDDENDRKEFLKAVIGPLSPPVRKHYETCWPLHRGEVVQWWQIRLLKCNKDSGWAGNVFFLKHLLSAKPHIQILSVKPSIQSSARQRQLLEIVLLVAFEVVLCGFLEVGKESTQAYCNNDLLDMYFQKWA